MGVIYSLRFPGSSRRYVGSTKNVKNRESSHRSLLRKGTHACRALQNAVWKYGLENMIVEILQEDVRIEWLVPSEQHWLDHFAGQLYNRLKIAAARPQAIISDETRARYRAVQMGNLNRKGIPHSPEVRARLSLVGKLAFKEGRRTYSTRPFALFAYSEKVKLGLVPHPSKRKLEYILDVLSYLHETESISETAIHFEMTTANVRSITKNAMADIEEAVERALGRRGFAEHPKYQRNKRIHPDWFEFVKGEPNASLFSG